MASDQHYNQQKGIPIGYRFLPKDEELITYYLNVKIQNETIRVDHIHDANIYEFNPQTLTGMHRSVGKDEWFFFTSRDRKYPNGSRPNRSAGSGYWKATAAYTRIFNDQHKIIGFKRSLVFYEGKPPNGSKTNWIMHEYTSNLPHRNKRNANDMRLDDWVLCRIHLRTTKSNRRQLENIQIHPIDQIPHEVIGQVANTTTTIDNNDYNHQGIIQENVDGNVHYDDGAIRFYAPDQIQVVPHLMEDTSLAIQTFQSNIDFQARFGNGGANSFDDQNGFPLQNVDYGQEATGSGWENEDILDGSSFVELLRGSSSGDDFLKVDDVLNDVQVSPNNPYEKDECECRNNIEIGKRVCYKGHIP